MKNIKTKKRIITLAAIFVIATMLSLTASTALYSPFSPIPALAQVSTLKMFEKNRADYVTEELVSDRDVIKYYKTINGIKTGDWYQLSYDAEGNIDEIVHSGHFVSNQKVLPILFNEIEPQAKIVRSVYTSKDLGEYEYELIETTKEIFYGVDKRTLIPIECRKNIYRTTEKIFVGYYVIEDGGTTGFSVGKLVDEPIGEPYYIQPFYIEEIVTNLNDANIIEKSGFQTELNT